MTFRVQIPHGSTPTGVGLAVDDAGNVKLTSPCCGEFFYEAGQSTLDPKWSISAWCSGCKLEWTQLMFDTEAVLYFDLTVEDLDGQKRWLAGALGYNEDSLEVTVE